MATASRRPKFVVIAGPTACGKSSLAIRIAKRFNGEIISADSLTVYKRMDIGAAKPPLAQRQGVKHWGFDLVGPGQRFTAAQFKRYALDKMADIQARGKLPVIAGGTGLYIDALLFDFSFAKPASARQRQQLEAKTTAQLQALIKRRGWPMPANARNRRHLIRTIERRGRTGSRQPKPPADALIIGLLPDNGGLRQKIADRVHAMFQDGLVDETRGLIKLYGADSLVAKAKVAYGPVVEYLAGHQTLAEAEQGLATAHWQYARRQKTWFRRNKFIHWFNNQAGAEAHIARQLNK